MKRISLVLVVLMMAVGIGVSDNAVNQSLVNLPIDSPVISRSLAPVDIPRRDEEILFEEDFENDAEGWSTYDFTNVDTAWHKSNFRPPDEENDDDMLWWCGDTLDQFDDDPVGYNNFWYQLLCTPVLDLSDAGGGLTLTFDAYWLLEDPRRVPGGIGRYDGWDGWFLEVSTNGGDDFEVIEPESPEYYAELLSAAGRVWDLGDVPGYTFESKEGGVDDWDAEDDDTPEPEWVEITVDMTDFAGEAEVVLRFVLVSDRTVSAPWNPYLANSGVFIDNIVMFDEDEREFLVNNCDDDPFPAELIPVSGHGMGNFWDLTEVDHHSGDWSMWHPDGEMNILSGLESPAIELPENLTIWVQNWVYCDLVDSDSDIDGFLDDFYELFVSDDDGESWTRINYDYKRDGAGGDDWVHYVPGIPFNGSLSLDDWEGETIRILWRIRTDHDQPDGEGNGLFIDDVEVVASNRNARDAGMENLHVGYPTTVGLRLEEISADMYNYGLDDLRSINAGWGWVSDEGEDSWPIAPYRSLDSDEMEHIALTDYDDLRNPSWAPTMPGLTTVWARTRVGLGTEDPDDDDENFANDSVGVENVMIWPEGLYEFGNDNRTYQFTFEFDPGEGAMTYFSPQDFEFEEYSIAAVHFRFNGEQDEASTFNLHIFGAGEDNMPGERLLELEVEVPVDSCLPNHMTVPLYAQDTLRGLSDDFWVWVEVTRDDHWPEIIGDEQLRGEGRYFQYDGENLVDYPRDLMMHALIVPTAEVEANLENSIDLVDFGEVIIGDSETRRVSLYSVGLEDVTITGVTATNEAFEVDWDDDVTLHIGEAVTFDVTFTPETENLVFARLEIESNDETPPRISLTGSPLSVGDDNSLLPVEFGMSNPYPNPFNNNARIDFSLDRSGAMTLVLYDLNGRRIASVLNASLNAGHHSTILNGDGISAGIYFLRLESTGRAIVHKVALIK